MAEEARASESPSGEVSAAALHRGSRENLPDEGWGCLTDFPSPRTSLSLSLTMQSVGKYFMSGRAADGLPRDDFRNLSDESFALYYKKYGRDGEVCLPSPAHDPTDSPRPRLYFRFKFKATMKQNVRYAVEVVLEKSSGTLFDTLSYTSCQCPGGAPPATCKHVAAACYGLEEYTRTGVFRGCTSSTSELCKWNAPPPQRRVMDMTFAHLAHSSFGAAKRDASKRQEHDPRPPSKRQPSVQEESERFVNLLTAASAKQGGSQGPAFLHVLPQASPKTALATQLQASTVVIPVMEDIVHTFKAAQSIDLRDSPLTEIAMEQLSEKLSLTLQQRHAIEYRTRGQATVQLWHSMRRGRLTASVFGSIVKRIAPAGPLAERLLHKAQELNVEAICWGRDNESTARMAYVEHQQVPKPGLKVSLSGLVLAQNGYLGCSPDGIVFDPTCTSDEQRGLLEVKCPLSANGLTISQACQLPSFPCILSEDGSLQLKAIHPYYHQVQGSMAITGCSWCDFVVWTEKWLSVERIEFNSSLWKAEMLPKLETFFWKELLPRL